MSDLLVENKKKEKIDNARKCCDFVWGKICRE